MDTGLTLKDAQALARHATPELTLNVYGRPREDRMSEAVEQVAEEVLWEEKCAISVQRLAGGTEIENATSLTTEGCASKIMAPAVGLEPTTRWLTATCSTS